jgi:hypothetical protein
MRSASGHAACRHDATRQGAVQERSFVSVGFDSGC